jgi:hypothetical protein
MCDTNVTSWHHNTKSVVSELENIAKPNSAYIHCLINLQAFLYLNNGKLIQNLIIYYKLLYFHCRSPDNTLSA